MSYEIKQNQLRKQQTCLEQEWNSCQSITSHKTQTQLLHYITTSEKRGDERCENQRQKTLAPAVVRSQHFFLSVLMCLLTSCLFMFIHGKLSDFGTPVSPSLVLFGALLTSFNSNLQLEIRLGAQPNINKCYINTEELLVY